MGTNRRLMSIAYDSDMNETASVMPGQYVMAYATAPGMLMGSKGNADAVVDGLEQIVELTTFGQVLNADASAAVDDEGDYMVSMTRVFIPLDMVEGIIQFLQRAKLASPGDHPDKPTVEGGSDGETSGSTGD